MPSSSQSVIQEEEKHAQAAKRDGRMKGGMEGDGGRKQDRWRMDGWRDAMKEARWREDVREMEG
jgi:hypothetical protein